MLFKEVTRILREAVIDPNLDVPIEELVKAYTEIKGTKELNQYFNPYDIYFVDKEQFEKLAHPKDLQFVPGSSFAYTHPTSGLIAFVNMMPSKKQFRNILRHELIHRQQVARQVKRSGKAHAPDIADEVSYANNKQEMMAWAQTTLDWLTDSYSDSKVLKILREPSSNSTLSSQLRRLKPENRKKFLKYLYQYAISELSKK